MVSRGGSKIKVVVIDYGMGNIKSVINALKYLKAEVKVTNEPSETSYEKMVIPGVGSFGDGMRNLSSHIQEVEEAVASDTPLLGICIGMQAFFEGSEESPWIEGMGLMRGMVEKMDTWLKLPHIGWNTLEIKKRDCPLFKNIDGGHVYFVHSYHPIPQEDVVAATSNYGCEIVASVWKENVYGTQFHPEKSGVLGLRVLKNFLDL